MRAMIQFVEYLKTLKSSQSCKDASLPRSQVWISLEMLDFFFFVLFDQWLQQNVTQSILSLLPNSMLWVVLAYSGNMWTYGPIVAHLWHLSSCCRQTFFGWWDRPQALRWFLGGHDSPTQSDVSITAERTTRINLWKWYHTLVGRLSLFFRLY